MFFWLLWGDFAFTFFEQVFGRFMPIYLKELHASNTLIGIMTGSIAGVVNLFFLPNISHWCDRLRTPIGRRIPLLLIATPLTVISVILVGFAPEIGDWLYRHCTHGALPAVSHGELLLFILCTFTVSYHFFNMALVNAFNWLQRDVVPSMIMARFISWYRIISTLAAVLFSWYVFPTMIIHRQMTFLGVGLFYLIAFLLMCRGIKEGKYPEVPRVQKLSTLAVYSGYFRNCLKLPIYRLYFLWGMLGMVGGVSSGPFVTLYSRETLHLSMDDIGHFAAYSMVFSILVYAPMGWICDKFSDFRILLFSSCLALACPIIAYFFVNDRQSWMLFAIFSTVPGVATGLAAASLTMHIFPEKSFGQFSAGTNVFGCTGWLIGNYLIGLFMDWNNSNYRLAFLWNFTFAAAAVVVLLFVYRSWKQYGGPDHYQAPDPTTD